MTASDKRRRNGRPAIPQVSPAPALQDASPETKRGRDPQAAAIISRAQRIAACERELWAAIAPILQRHRCRLSTTQQIVDGQPGPLQIVIVALD